MKNLKEIHYMSNIQFRNNYSHILKILLIDRSKSKNGIVSNIIWANDNYMCFGGLAYSFASPITIELITGNMSKIIVPRALKNDNQKYDRKKIRGEVFTPFWMVSKQINDIINKFKVTNSLDLINQKWLEITCGEAPYLVTRYDVENGDIIDISNRVGILDRKLSVINKISNEYEYWLDFVKKAYKTVFGYEYNGDSLLIARENLLLSFIDYHILKWEFFPEIKVLESIAEIISYNLFQMDGINNTTPTNFSEDNGFLEQLSLFEDGETVIFPTKHTGEKVKIMNWDSNKLEYF